VAAVTLRPIEERDVERAGDVNFVAFYQSAVAHGQRPNVGTPNESRRYIRHLHAFDPLGGIVAEENGEIVGIGWLHPRGPVATIGPLAVDPRMQGRGIGRLLLERLIEVAGRGVPQIRLVHESHNAVSLGLYLRTGFRVVAPLLDLELAAGSSLVPPALPRGTVIRPASDGEDRSRVIQRDARAFGAQRPQSIDLYLQSGRVLVAARADALVGYALGIGFHGAAHLGSASAEDADVLLALLATLGDELSTEGNTVRILVPAGDRRLVDDVLRLGFRVVRACHYMVRGGGTSPPANYVLMNGDMM
jgi:ribosomal protein S18 acetylase RimI-like enzyme